MKTRRLGRNGPEVSALGLGCLSFGGLFGATTEAESLRTLDAAWDHGIDFLDVANIYGKGVSETVIGTWLATRGHRPKIATKAGIVGGSPHVVNNDPAYLRAELEGSLKRLGVDHVQLFYAHRHDPAVPAEDLAGTMQRLQEEGKILGYGLSEIAPYTLERAHAVHPVTAVQNEYSLWTRLPELGLIRSCAELGVTFVPFSPLARGMLGDVPLAPPQDGFRSRNPRFTGQNFTRNQAQVAAFRSFCHSRGWTTSATALAWVLAQGDHLLPIPGTRFAGNLREWLGAETIRFTPEDLAEIDRLLPPGWAYGDRYGDDQLIGVERYC